MSSLTAASAASAERPRTPSTVLERQVIHSKGEIVKIRVHARAERHSFTDKNGKRKEYLLFHQNVGKGFVNCYLHGDIDDCVERVVTARVEIERKKIERGDGTIRDLLQVSLFRVPAQEASRRLLILPKKPVEIPTDCTAFETLPPIEGVIILAPPDMKVPTSQNGTLIIAGGTVNSSRRPASTGDSQLDRLLGDGWAINREDATSVVLVKKNSDGTKRYLEHKKRKRA